MTPFFIRHHAGSRTKTFGLSAALWLFGIFTSMLLIGLWGRSVAGDQVTLEASTRAVLESEIVHDRVSDWLGDAVAAAGQFSPDDVAAVVDAVDDTPQMQAALDDVVDQVVAAALAPPGTATQIDLSVPVDTLVPVVAAALEDLGVVSDADSLRAAAQGASGIVLSADDQQLVSSTASEVKVLLTKVVVVAVAGLLLAGTGAMWISPDRLRQLRALAVRIGVSAITFAIIIRIGAWAVDPAGGRSPIAAGGAVLLNSNAHILAIVAVGAAVAATAMSVMMLQRHRPEPAPVVVDAPAVAPVVPDDDDDPTSEQPVLVGAGVN